MKRRKRRGTCVCLEAFPPHLLLQPSFSRTDASHLDSTRVARLPEAGLDSSSLLLLLLLLVTTRAALIPCCNNTNSA